MRNWTRWPSGFLADQTSIASKAKTSFDELQPMLRGGSRLLNRPASSRFGFSTATYPKKSQGSHWYRGKLLTNAYTKAEVRSGDIFSMHRGCAKFSMGDRS